MKCKGILTDMWTAERSLTNVLKAVIDGSVKHDVDASKLVKAC